MTTNSHLLEVRAMPTEFTSTGHWILLGFNFIVKLLHFEWVQPHLPDKRKYFQKWSTGKVFKLQKHTQTNLYPKISALTIHFFLKNNVKETIPSRSFWFHLQPGRYKLCTHPMDIKLAGYPHLKLPPSLEKHERITGGTTRYFSLFLQQSYAVKVILQKMTLEPFWASTKNCTICQYLFRFHRGINLTS